MAKLQAIYFLMLESGNLFECKGMVTTACQLITVKNCYSAGGRDYPKFDRFQGWVKKSEANKHQLEAILKYEKEVNQLISEETQNWTEPVEKEPTGIISGQHMVSKMFNSSIHKNLFD